jgi:ribosomal-protein-alanine N-acetyltransferase
MVSLRAGTAADVPALYALDKLCFAPPFRFSLRTMRSYLTAPDARCVIAERDGGLTGFVLFEFKPRPIYSCVYVVTLDVHPGHRRSGLGRTLLVEAELAGVQAGMESSRLHVFAGNEPALRFYHAHGYVHAQRFPNYSADGLDAFLCVKPLQNAKTAFQSSESVS